MSYLDDLLTAMEQEQVTKAAAAAPAETPAIDPAAPEIKAAGQGNPEVPAEKIAQDIANLPDHIKAAYATAAITRYNAALAERNLLLGDLVAKEAAEYDFDPQTKQALFNEAFFDQIDKLAAADPEFDALLFEQQKQAAFNAGYAAGSVQ